MTRLIGKRVSYPCAGCGKQITLDNKCKQLSSGKVYCPDCYDILKIFYEMKGLNIDDYSSV